METKKWYESKSIWGAFLMIAALITSQFGTTITADEQELISNSIVNIVVTAEGVVGAILAIYGRIKATKSIS